MISVGSLKKFGRSRLLRDRRKMQISNSNDHSTNPSLSLEVRSLQAIAATRTKGMDGHDPTAQVTEVMERVQGDEKIFLRVAKLLGVRGQRLHTRTLLRERKYLVEQNLMFDCFASTTA